jgi:hypothetical protein
LAIFLGQHVHFFLRGYLKSEVHSNRPHSIQELKDCIIEGTGTINGALLLQVMQNLRERLWQCIECYGGHLEQAIFKTKVWKAMP